MANKRKKRMLIGAGLIFGTIAVLFYLALREDPQFVEAANGIDKARADARAAFGTLTWEEHRLENNIEFSDDVSPWSRVQTSTPIQIAQFYNSDVTPTDIRAEIVQQEKQWYLDLAKKIEPIKIHHVESDDGIPGWHYGACASTKEVAKALMVGIIGAADSGDIESLELYTRTAYQVIEKLHEEVDEITALVSIANRAITASALGRAAVANRDNPEVLDAIATLLKEMPELPKPAEVIAGQNRSDNVLFSHIHTMKPGEVVSKVESLISGDLFTAPPSTPIDKINVIWEKLQAGESIRTPRSGKNTAAAYEARALETNLKAWKTASDPATDDATKANDLSNLKTVTQSSKDVSFKLAGYLLPLSGVMESLMRVEFQDNALKLVTEMSRRYPTLASLPNALPKDLNFTDPFGKGADAQYRKTPTGYLIYSRGVDQIDQGFVEDQQIDRAFYRGFLYSKDHLDSATVVNYTPTDPTR